MRTIDALSFHDGHIESILIAKSILKVAFQSWDMSQYNLIFQGCYYIKNNDCIGVDLGRISIKQSYEELIQIIGDSANDNYLGNEIPQIYTFYDSWEDKAILKVIANKVEVVECGKADDIKNALYEIQKQDYLGGQKFDKGLK